MTTQEMVFSLLATAVGSPLIVEAFKALVNWRKGRLSKIAALEAALDEAERAYEELMQRKRAMRATHVEEIEELNDRIRKYKEQILRLRMSLIALGHDPDVDHHAHKRGSGE